jgi:hypothetical protein
MLGDGLGVMEDQQGQASQEGGPNQVEAFTRMPLKKDGVDLCATKKIIRTCVPST